MMNLGNQVEVTSGRDPAVWGLARATRQDAARRDLECMIRQRYWTEHKSRTCHFLDHLLFLYGGAEELEASLSIGTPTDAPMLLERYLAVPVEVAIGETRGSVPARDRVVEIGSFASHDSKAATLLLLLAATWLDGFGADWGVFTATRVVRLRLRCLGVTLHDLGEANPEMLGEDATHWGQYYAADPRVVAASFSDALPLIRAIPSEFESLAERARLDGETARHEGRIAA